MDSGDAMLTVICVLKSGGDVYDQSWVEKLKAGVERNLTIPHEFVCLSDVEVPCKRIPLQHDWKCWWSKIELFRKGVITEPTLYLDLDTVIVGNINALARQQSDFAMLPNVNVKGMVGSGIMWFNEVPHHVYEKFAKMPQCYIEHHERNANASTCYIGDQAFIHDALNNNVDTITTDGIKSFKHDCRNRLPIDASVVCFHGKPRPNEVHNEWMERYWK